MMLFDNNAENIEDSNNLVKMVSGWEVMMPSSDWVLQEYFSLSRIPDPSLYPHLGWSLSAFLSS